jgi:hypothetical protein
MFRTGFLSIIRSLVLYTQQQVCHTVFAQQKKGFNKNQNRNNKKKIMWRKEGQEEVVVD